MSGGTDVCTAFVGGCSLKPIIKGQIQSRCLGAAVFSYNESGEKQIDIEGELVITKAMPSMPLGFWGDNDQSKIKNSYYEKYSGLWCHGDWVTITQQGGIIISGRSDATLNKFGIISLIIPLKLKVDKSILKFILIIPSYLILFIVSYDSINVKAFQVEYNFAFI